MTRTIAELKEKLDKINGRGPNVLIVEDSAPDAHATSRILTSIGCLVTVANSGEEALAMVSEATDLIIIDLRLPRMEGSDVAREAVKKFPNLPVVLITDSTQLGFLGQRIQPGEIMTVTCKPLTESAALQMLHKHNIVP